MKTSDEPVVVEDVFNADIKTVWKAITEVNQMTKWFFDNIPDFEAEVGFETQFNVNSGERDFLHIWKIIEVEPFKKITYDWSYKDYPGRGLVSFELFEEENSTKLRLTNTVIEDFPDEIQPLVSELNNLIDHNAVLLKRARNRLADLAHSIKNPLTVINNEAHNLQPDQRELIHDQTNDIERSVDHYLTRARASGMDSVLGARAHIKTVAEDLAFAMRRIHKDRNLEIDFTGLGSCSFRGEAQDLEEILGNLMDNACKWANSRVIVHCSSREDRCKIVVEDDGPGIPEEELEMVLNRGHRLDETTPGHGLGLNIVKEIVEIYGGKIRFSRSGYGGLLAELDLPGA